MVFKDECTCLVRNVRVPVPVLGVVNVEDVLYYIASEDRDREKKGECCTH